MHFQNIGPNLVIGEPLVEQLDIWERSLIDVEEISRKLDAMQKDNDKLRDKILLLERKVQVSFHGKIKPDQTKQD